MASSPRGVISSDWSRREDMCLDSLVAWGAVVVGVRSAMMLEAFRPKAVRVRGRSVERTKRTALSPVTWLRPM